ncbi:unnamed protein product [Schistosoma turkestanicum]|nr:unnamed protein product [Schistosoma turkestanicum]
MDLYNSDSLNLDINQIKTELHSLLYSLHSSTSSETILLSASLSLPRSSSILLLFSVIFKSFFKLFLSLQSSIQLNAIFMTDYLLFLFKCIKSLLRQCLTRYTIIIANNNDTYCRCSSNSHRMQLLSRRDIGFYKHLPWYRETKSVSDQLKSSENINHRTTTTDTAHNAFINVEYDSSKHSRCYPHRTISSDGSLHRFQHSVQYYVIFMYILFTVLNVQCIYGKPTSSSKSETFIEISSPINSSNSPSSTILPNSSLPLSSLMIFSNHTTEPSSVDDLMLQYLDLSTFPKLNLTQSNRKVPIINVFMRSQRTRRSLSFYMSNYDTSPLFLTPSVQNYPAKARFLSIDNNGSIRLVKSYKDSSGKLLKCYHTITELLIMMLLLFRCINQSLINCHQLSNNNFRTFFNDPH